jgi:hypothetical protein
LPCLPPFEKSALSHCRILTRDATKMNLQSLFDCRIDVIFDGVATEEYLDRESAARNVEHRNIAKEHGELFRVHCRRGYNQFEVLASRDHLVEPRRNAMDVNLRFFLTFSNFKILFLSHKSLVFAYVLVITNEQSSKDKQENDCSIFNEGTNEIYIVTGNLLNTPKNSSRHVHW